MELTINGDLSCMKYLCKDDALEMLSMQLREQIGGVQLNLKEKRNGTNKGVG